MSRAPRHAFVSRMHCRRPRAVPSVALRIVERASELKRLFEKTILLIVHTKRKFDNVGRGGSINRTMLLHVRKLCAPYLPLRGLRRTGSVKCRFGKFRHSNIVTLFSSLELEKEFFFCRTRKKPLSKESGPEPPETKRACSSKTWENMPALQVLLLRIRLLAAIVGTSLVNLKKQNGPITVVVLSERAASRS